MKFFCFATLAIKFTVYLFFQIVAAACLFFACKVEEHPRPLKQFIETIQQLIHRSTEPLNPNSEVNIEIRSFFRQDY